MESGRGRKKVKKNKHTTKEKFRAKNAIFADFLFLSNRYCVDLLHRVNAEAEVNMLPLSETATIPPSLVTIHVEILPPNDAVR